MNTLVEKIFLVMDLDGHELSQRKFIHFDEAEQEAKHIAEKSDYKVCVFEMVAAYQKGRTPIEKLEVGQVPKQGPDCTPASPPAPVNPYINPDTDCQKHLKSKMWLYPRTCPTCGLSGKCVHGL